MIYRASVGVATRGRGTYPVTDEINRQVMASGVSTGICHLFLRHTSASLILCENADPDVRSDLERFMSRLVPDGDRIFNHVLEGPDDMPAHIRNILTHSDLSLPVTNGHCDVGTWQGVYLWEHRTMAHRREITVTVTGE